MYILTSHFDFAQDFDPNTFALISIAGKTPAGWTGLEYRELAPSWSIWKEWCDSQASAIDFVDVEKANEHYTKRFTQEILYNLNPVNVITKLQKLSQGKIPVLLCYEKSNEFCHRHLVAKWLKNYTEAMRKNNAGFDDDIQIEEATTEIIANKTVTQSNQLSNCNDIPNNCDSCDSVICEENGKAYCSNIWRITRLINSSVMNIAKIYAEWEKNGINSVCFENTLDRLIEKLQESGKLFRSYKDNDGKMPIGNNIFCPDHHESSCKG